MKYPEMISLRVRPRSSRAGVTVEADGGMVVSVHASALEGAANRECIALLAEAVGVPKSAVQIVRGQKSRLKKLAIEGLATEEVISRLKQRSPQRTLL